MEVLSFPSPIRSASPFSSRLRLSPFRFRFRFRRRFSAWFAETIVTASTSGERSADVGDLKSWLHQEGLPPCKVVLKERPSHDGKHRPIHYVAASEDLKAGDVAFSVPNSLVVTLERVLGNEAVGT